MLNPGSVFTKCTLKSPTARDVWESKTNVKLQMQTFKFSHPGTNCPHSHKISRFFLGTKPSNLLSHQWATGQERFFFFSLKRAGPTCTLTAD